MLPCRRPWMRVPCDIMGVDPNLAVPYVMNYNLAITHAFTPTSLSKSNMSATRPETCSTFRYQSGASGASYCLNRADASADRDAVLQSVTPIPGPLATQESRPYYTKFPYLGFINYITNRGIPGTTACSVDDTADDTRLFVQRRVIPMAMGLTTARRIALGLPQNSNNVAGEYASSDFDIRHRVTFTATYNIPGIKGLGQLLEGWQLNGIVNLRDAQPWNVGGMAIATSAGRREIADRWDIFGNPATSLRRREHPVLQRVHGAGGSPVRPAASCSL